MELTTLIVDDEYAARHELRFMLSDYECINIVGEATNSQEALKLIKSVAYNLVFLDINLPNTNGIDLGNIIQQMPNPPMIIYVTAYDSYAVKAFDVNATDYILKPIDEDKLKRAINRAIENYRVQEEPQGNNLEDDLKTHPLEKFHEDTKVERVNRITAEFNGKIILIDTNDIIYAYTENESVLIRTHDKVLTSRSSLIALEDKLDSKIFFRSHRSYVVNLNKVLEISPFFNGTYILVMRDKEHTTVPVSRRQAKKLKMLLDF
ncbi:two component transcriptional regulator, LytTR family [Natronincola peptidivorans]|uniref:Stage 0 sporulation protein A homolog n=1 Tax=Natronincola peptidivorans TaxID=426128 RepID=A0A1I0H0I5_9FIRM|nr:LytTR family DNA-binding domain-containing protein [Natronincola peptidivorans]SET77013.1 two component transcriptional regulator, LytTR family [Natronincola peptidivorans]